MLIQIISPDGDRVPHELFIVIPVADRPLHLRDCLASLRHLCREHGHAGGINILIADDSREAESQAAHRAIAAETGAAGIPVEYFGLDEQLALLAGQKTAIPQRILGDRDACAFHHKGASITRNITYLRLAQIARIEPSALFWFIDSDQEFRTDGAGIDYPRELARIFASPAIQVLTGKVVGDPPVSPAVMAGTFLEDILAFLRQLASVPATASCCFHATPAPRPDRAAYHDMAGLFGFAPEPAHDYPCPLDGQHDHAACLEAFSAALGRFFHGEHPTRKTRYQAGDALASVVPARTVYTGNYVIRAGALRHFIPFAPLGLRMAGPTLGRILQAELGAGFVSANLPMLHKRTVEATGQAEFRPGVQIETEIIDLAGEFERQFYGDVMLFTVETLCANGFPALPPDAARVTTLLAEQHDRLEAQYETRRQAILARLDELRAQLDDDAAWWNHEPRRAAPRARIESFMANMARNFGRESSGHALMRDRQHRAARHAAMREAILNYPADRRAWEALLGS